MSSRSLPRLDSRFADGSPDDADVQPIVEALQDPDCRRILRVAGDDPLTVKELADACRLPLSTTYRKVDLLLEADLVSEGVRVREDGKHPAQYVRRVDEVTVDLTVADGFEFRSKIRGP